MKAFGISRVKLGVGAVAFVVICVVFLHRSTTNWRKVARPFKGKSAVQIQKKTTKSQIGKGRTKPQFVAEKTETLPKKSSVYRRADLVRRLEEWEKLSLKAISEPRVSRFCDSIVVGVRKCGTGAILSFLGNHPLVRIPKHEAHYYDQPKSLEKGVEYYKSLLPNASSQEKLMEKTPAYFVSYPADFPSMIKKDSPKVKIIVTLCDPVHRVLSEYARLVQQNKTAGIPSTFDQFVDETFGRVEKFYHDFNIKDQSLGLDSTLHKWSLRDQTRNEEEENFVYKRGIYVYNMRRWMKIFGPDRILIVNGNRILTDPGAVIERVQKFLKIPVLLKRNDFTQNPETGLYCLHRWWSTIESKAIRRSKKDTYEYKFASESSDCLGKSKGRTRKSDSGYFMSPAVKKRLQTFYRPFNKELFVLLNRTFDW